MSVAKKHAQQGATQGGDLLGDAVKERETADLVFGVTGYVGSGLSHVATALGEELKAAGFAHQVVVLSDLLAQQVGIDRTHTKTIADVGPLQDAGDELRARHGSSIVAGLGIREIRERRDPVSEPRAFVVDSIKHPKEVEILRAVYGRGFYLIGVLCNRDVRFRRLRRKFKNEEDTAKIENMMSRDEAGRERHGQHVRKTLHRSDLFVANNEDAGEEKLGEQLERFLQAVTGSSVVRPTADEKGMHAAWSASLRSSCMSRQVGAAVLNRAGEILATGTNDPPAFRGGLYSEDSADDYRCFQWRGDEDRPYCRNDRKKQEIYEEIREQLIKAGALQSEVSSETVGKALGRTRVRALIEFSRAIHAEMDALLAIARRGVGIPPKSSLYCTAFPCHSCARHMVAAGLEKVVYLEPYDKSLALELHPDALRETSVASPTDSAGNDERVLLQLFTGVAPRRFAALFEKRRELKEGDGSGNLVQLGQGAAHADLVLKRSFLQLERELAEKVEAELQRAADDARA